MSYPNRRRTEPFAGVSSDKTFLVVFMIAFFLIMGTATVIARNHGVSSCEERGGIPVTRSWFSDSPWDVSCIVVTP